MQQLRKFKPVREASQSKPPSQELDTPPGDHAKYSRPAPGSGPRSNGRGCVLTREVRGEDSRACALVPASPRSRPSPRREKNARLPWRPGSPSFGWTAVSLGSEAGRPAQFSKNLQPFFPDAPARLPRGRTDGPASRERLRGGGGEEKKRGACRTRPPRSNDHRTTRPGASRPAAARSPCGGGHGTAGDRTRPASRSRCRTAA